MTHPLLQFFVFAHLPPHLQAVSQPFSSVAAQIDACPSDQCQPIIEAAVAGLRDQLADLTPLNMESEEARRKLRAICSFVRGYGTAAGGMSKNNALRLLLEAKDCAVRGLLYKEPANV